MLYNKFMETNEIVYPQICSSFSSVAPCNMLNDLFSLEKKPGVKILQSRSLFKSVSFV